MRCWRPSRNRVVLLVAATTENPSFSVVRRCFRGSLILQLQPLAADDIRNFAAPVVTRARFERQDHH